MLVNMGFAERLPKVVACGPRHLAFRSFRNALLDGKSYPILLVDSEDLVDHANQSYNPFGAWQHLHSRDKWERPDSALSDQAQMMVTCMETWIVADRNTLRNYFPILNENPLPNVLQLESCTRKDINSALKNATATSQKGAYKKGRDSFDLLGKLNPDELKSKLPHFRRFVNALDTVL